MKLTVIGKYGPYAAPSVGATSCYLVQEKGINIVMDMGSGTLSRLLGLVSAEQIDAIVLTHLHFDHTSDLLTFRYLVEGMAKKPVIYAPRDYGKWYDVLLDGNFFTVINYDEDSVLRLGDVEISFFRTKHTVLSYGIRVKGEKTLAYTGDTLFYDGIVDDLASADFIIADCSKPAGFNGPHMTVTEARQLKGSLKGRLLTSHANADYSPVADLEGSGVEFAEELREYEI